MQSIIIEHGHTWQPLAYFGITHTFFDLNSEILINTWCAIGVIFVFALIGRYTLSRPDTLACYVTTSVLRSFIDMVQQSLGRCPVRYFYFIASIFIYIFVCNALILIPGLEEPTKDLNTTFAMACCTVFYVHASGFRTHGIFGYLGEFFKMPFTLFPNGFRILDIPAALFKAILNILMAAFTGPFELLGKLTNLLSLSLRLFGNIFGGSIISGLFKQAVATSWVGQIVALVLGLNLIIALFFGLFEAYIQAFVFSILSTTYLTMAVQGHDEHPAPAGGKSHA
jgi:F-type H+-transporting ATPase subunit a